MGIADESAAKRIADLKPPEWRDKPAQIEPEERVQYIVEKGLTEVPAESIQPLHMRPAQRQRSQLGGNGAVAVIDMTLVKDEEGKKQVQAEIASACEEWGFFQVIKHGVPASLMDAVMDMARRTFARTSEEKEEFKIRDPRFLLVAHGSTVCCQPRRCTGGVPNTSRFSIGGFALPHQETLLQPAVELCDQMNPPLYRGLAYQEYISEYMKHAIHINSRAVELVRLVPVVATGI